LDKAIELAALTNEEDGNAILTFAIKVDKFLSGKDLTK